jgi:fatty acid desaturase
MAMPSGESPQHAREFYQYLLAHHETEHRVETWYVDWLSLAWMWGFIAALSVILLWWVWQYRTTRQKAGIYSVDDWGGYTRELARPVTRFFVLFTAIVTGFAVALIVGHIVNGQIF